MRSIYRLSVLVFVVFLLGTVAAAQDCGKDAELWFPPNGEQLDGGVSVQEITSTVCQGEPVTITTTVDNMSCGETNAGFDIDVYYDSYDAAHLIDTIHVDHLDGCEHVTHTFTWDTTGVTPGDHHVLVWVDPDNTVAELNEGNNQYDMGIVTVNPNAPLVEATKEYTDEDGGNVNPDDLIKYTVRITNTGCADQGDNSGHEFVDDLPAGVSPTGTVTSSSGTAAVVGDQVVWDGEIPAGGSVTITFEVKVDSDVADSTDICNQGIVNWDSDGDGTNDAQEPTDDPATSTDDDPTCFTVYISNVAPLVGTIDAPTLSEWAQITLTVLIALAFTVMLLRRRKATA